MDEPALNIRRHGPSPPEATPSGGPSPDAPSKASRPDTIIEAGRRRAPLDFSELWEYREVVYFLVWRDFKVRYRQTYLGVLWAVIQPVVSTGVFTVVFGRVVGVPTDGIPYPVFALSGLVAWIFFSRALTSMTSSLTSNQEMVRRVYFPRIAVPLSTMLTAAADLLVGLALIAVTMAAFQMAPPVQVLLLPAFLLQMVATALGIGLIMAAVNVRFRDVGYLVPFATQTLLFLTPVVYPSSLLSDAVRPLFALNPMVGVLDGMRWCLFGTPPSWPAIAVSLLVAVVVLWAGLAWFARSERGFADVI